MNHANKITGTILFSVGVLLSANPAHARFLSIDPVPFDQNNPGSFNRFAYVNNDPMNAIDPNGEEAWLISRPSVAGQNHMFVAVKDDKTGDITRFTYGPKGNIVFPGKLVSLTNSKVGTDRTDKAALKSFLADPSAAAESGIVAEVINASDADVIASGQAVDAALGTKDKAEKSAPYYRPTPLTGTNTANSNSAAYAVADRANPNDTQAVPNKGKNSGQRQHRNIPRTGTRIKDRD